MYNVHTKPKQHMRFLVHVEDNVTHTLLFGSQRVNGCCVLQFLERERVGGGDNHLFIKSRREQTVPCFTNAHILTKTKSSKAKQTKLPKA